MRQIRLFLFLSLASVSIAAVPGPVDSFSSQDGGCTDACLAVLNAAKSSIYIQANSVISASLEEALVAAGKRGVKIEAIIDTPRVSIKSLPSLIAPARPIAHKNILITVIVDDVIVIRGTLNFSKSAEDKNVESMLIIRDPGLTASYQEAWKEYKARTMKLRVEMWSDEVRKMGSEK